MDWSHFTLSFIMGVGPSWFYCAAKRVALVSEQARRMAWVCTQTQKAHGERDALAMGIGCTWRHKKGTWNFDFYYHQIVFHPHAKMAAGVIHQVVQQKSALSYKVHGCDINPFCAFVRHVAKVFPHIIQSWSLLTGSKSSKAKSFGMLGASKSSSHF